MVAKTELVPEDLPLIVPEDVSLVAPEDVSFGVVEIELSEEVKEGIEFLIRCLRCPLREECQVCKEVKLLLRKQFARLHKGGK